MKRLADLAGAGGIAALGICGLVTGFGYGVGAVTEPGPGLLPALAGAALVVLAVVAAAESLRATAPVLEASEEAPLAPNAGWRVLGYAFGILAFALLMERLGTLLAVALFLAWIVRFVERQSWRLTLALAAATTAGVWLLFVKALNVTLPM
jgi:hypothetical protein